MQLVIHDQGTVLNAVSSLSSVEVQGNNVKWHDGEMRDIQKQFVILPPEVVVGSTLTPEQLAKDMKTSLPPREQQLQQQINQIQETINFLLGL